MLLSKNTPLKDVYLDDNGYGNGIGYTDLTVTVTQHSCKKKERLT